jgi:hypothetical protein
VAYACPVCETIAPDGEHLAHHLAIVAMTRNEEHETWLDDHAPDWQESSPGELAAVATERADEIDHELADEAAGGRPDVGHAHGHGGDRGRRTGDTAPSTDAGDDETAAVLAEAQELTQRMLGEDEEASDGGRADADDQGGDEPSGVDPDATAETDSDE